MEGVRIQKEHIYNVSTPSYKAGTESHIVPAGEIFDTLDFVSGIHACANYGQAKSLERISVKMQYGRRTKYTQKHADSGRRNPIMRYPQI